MLPGCTGEPCREHWRRLGPNRVPGRMEARYETAHARPLQDARTTGGYTTQRSSPMHGHRCVHSENGRRSCPSHAGEQAEGGSKCMQLLSGAVWKAFTWATALRLTGKDHLAARIPFFLGSLEPRVSQPMQPTLEACLPAHGHAHSPMLCIPLLHAVMQIAAQHSEPSESRVRRRVERTHGLGRGHVGVGVWAWHDWRRNIFRLGRCLGGVAFEDLIWSRATSAAQSRAEQSPEQKGQRRAEDDGPRTRRRSRAR